MKAISVKPQVVLSLYQLFERFKKAGFTENDIVVLIQERTKPKLTKTQIRITIEAAKHLEGILDKISKNLKLDQLK